MNTYLKERLSGYLLTDREHLKGWDTKVLVVGLTLLNNLLNTSFATHLSKREYIRWVNIEKRNAQLSRLNTWTQSWEDTLNTRQPLIATGRRENHSKGPYVDCWIHRLNLGWPCRRILMCRKTGSARQQWGQLHSLMWPTSPSHCWGSPL